MFADPVLLPYPRQIEKLEGELALPAGRPVRIAVDGPGLDPVVKRIEEDFATVLGAEERPEIGALNVEIGIGTMAGIRPQGYRLRIEPERIAISAAGAAGCYYAAMTLRQYLRTALLNGKIPCVAVEDWPDFHRRGVLIDISRDKVPTMASLRETVAKLAEFKINEIQLYTEHTFAYSGHRSVWENASPLTAGEIQELDALCREYFIDLVPNQNCFGHMERWLVHEPYAALAECPEGWRHPLEPERLRPPAMLSPVDPGSVELARELFAELLPNFTSGRVNVNCDETFELGQGRSREEAKRRGAGRVYLDYLGNIHAIAAEAGKRMMFWGDVILKHPELIAELPRDAIALAWGYEANHPFERDLPRFAEAGLDFYVCPGASTWNSIAGRWANARANLTVAAREGLKNGAAGYLITDWGDNGHLQHWPFSWPGYALGAALAWSRLDNEVASIPDALDAHVFMDRAGIAGRLVCGLGDAGREAGITPHNGSVLHSLLARPDINPLEGEYGGERPGGDFAERLGDTRIYVDRLSTQLTLMKLQIPIPLQLRDEIINAAAMLRHACRLGLARLEAPGGLIENIPDDERSMLALDLRVVLAVYRRLWGMRNRPGGLEDSARRLEDLLTLYENSASRD